VNRALLWLMQGNWTDGWREYEWRLQTKEYRQHALAGPRWDGAPLAGRTIILVAERGLGDTIQFVRYAPLVRERGGRVIVLCQGALQPLLAGAPGIDQLAADDRPLPAFHVHARLHSLPAIFQTTLKTVPAAVPHLEADTALANHWSQELAAYAGYKIGIAWQGSRKFAGDRERSIPLAHFKPLAEVRGVQLVSLQKGPGSEQLRDLGGKFPIIDLGGRLDVSSGAFMDTAAVMKSLDLVVTSDTAIAHLAGALGVPVWVALSSSPDWRWMMERSDSPWYPSMVLFRQHRRGDWGEVFERIARAAKERINARQEAIWARI
jgi:Glycosyltransferase family 9 (heptosyltransferase)